MFGIWSTSNLELSIYTDKSSIKKFWCTLMLSCVIHLIKLMLLYEFSR